MSIDRLDWDTLRIFRVVAELSSMSAAAARLGESPPTISRKIDDLEKSLGIQVFLRSTRGVELTETGKQEEYRLRLSDLIRRGDASANVMLMPGDTIIIPESRF